MDRLTRALSLLSMGLAVGLPAAADTPPGSGSTPSSDAAVWQKRQYRFQFMGFTATYSCDGLADKLKLLLKHSGARADAKAVSGACASGFGRPDKFASADLTFYTLGSPSADDASQPTPATWRKIEIAPHKPRDLGAGDCELVDQFRQQVLPMFTTRNLENNTSCVPHQLSGSTVGVKFEVLTAVPTPKTPASSSAPSKQTS